MVSLKKVSTCLPTSMLQKGTSEAARVVQFGADNVWADAATTRRATRKISKLGIVWKKRFGMEKQCQTEGGEGGRYLVQRSRTPRKKEGPRCLKDQHLRGTSR